MKGDGEVLTTDRLIRTYRIVLYVSLTESRRSGGAALLP